MKTVTRTPAVRQHRPPHPGEVLAGLWMEPLGLTVTAVADALGVSRKTVSKIVNGNGAVTPEMALRLELAFGASAQSWLGHQATFDLWQVEQSRGKLSRQVRRVELREAVKAMPKMTAKQRAAWERSRDLDAGLREMLADIKHGRGTQDRIRAAGRWLHAPPRHPQ